jgi:hypothetical protein
MQSLPKQESSGCQEFREELEATPLGENRGSELRMALEQMTPASREHASRCVECRQAAEDLALMRSVLRPLGEVSAEPGPWFSAQVMTAITGRQAEMDLRDGVWISVRRLAPRLVAVSALLLVLASTWTYQLRRTDVPGVPQAAASDTVLEPGGAAPLNDDVLISASEGHR